MAKDVKVAVMTKPTTIIVIDISNPSCSFMRQEWEVLGDGRNIV